MRQDRDSRRPALKQIAHAAGVSVSTASLVLAGKAAERRISPEAERRVRQAAEEHDYAPNLLVRSLQQGRTGVLSLFNAYGHRYRGDLYTDRLSTAIECAAGERGYDILVHCDFSRSAEETYRILNGGRADGLLFYGPSDDHPLLPLLRGSRLPAVMVGREDPENALSSVRPDMPVGAALAADAVADLGHRRIACLGGPWADARPRIAAFRARLRERGVQVSDEWVLGASGAEAPSWEKLLRALLEQPDPPTALFCWHDRLGYRVLEVCEALGVRVPEQLSLISYDGLHWPSTSRHVLDSIDTDFEELAASAVRLLDQLLRGEVTAPDARVFPVRLAPGTTLAPPP